MNKPIFLTGCILAVSIYGQAWAGTNVWGLSNINKTNSKSSAPYTVYIGSYINLKNAQKMKSELKAKGYDAKIKMKKNSYVVFIGPLANRQALHRLAVDSYAGPKLKTVHPIKLSHAAVHPARMTPQPQNIPFVANARPQQSFNSGIKTDKRCKDCSLDQNKWFVQLQGGAIFPLNHGQILVANGSDFPAPENVDIYATQQSTQGTIALTVGKQIVTQSSLIKHYTLSGRLQYKFLANVGNTIMEYSAPEFLNYNYNWKLAALALTADSKVNLFSFSNFSPYVNGGLGVSFNQAQSYKETALPDVTARISPAYANHTLTQFTYHVGAGVDFSCTQNWLLSAGYEFESFGHFASGKGKSTWSGESLPWGSYQGNTVLLGITYLTGN